MPHRSSRKITALFLGWLMLLVFWCQGMVYPVKGELGMDTFEFVELQVLEDTEEDTLPENSEESNSEVQAKVQLGNRIENKLEGRLDELSDGRLEKLSMSRSGGTSQQEPSIANDVLLITVQSGDTLSEIAYRYKTTVADIVRHNKLEDPDSIFIGQKLKIPNHGSYSFGASLPSRGEMQISAEDFELLARIIHAEARGEDFEGQIAVGAVVLNRLADARFPNTIREVIYQPGAFTAVSDKQINLTPNQSAFLAAEAALRGEDPTNGAIYYYNPKTATDRWIKTRPVVKTIGNHNFSI